MERDGFHWQDGWYFKRLDDGSVRIRKYDGPDQKEPTVEAVAGS